jgi:hypothetical protein
MSLSLLFASARVPKRYAPPVVSSSAAASSATARAHRLERRDPARRALA